MAHLHIHPKNACRGVNQPRLAYRPFDNIPNELLALILAWTSCALEKGQQQFKFPLTAPQLVSRRWRDVTLTTPSLWTTLQVRKSMPYARLKNYLQRSGSMSLNVEVFNAGSHLTHVSNIVRWAHVTLWLDSESHADEIIEKISPHARSLQHFSCIFLPILSHNTYMAKIGSLCPNLKSLHLTHVFPNWVTGPLSFKDLAELVLRGKGVDEEVHVETFLETLRASPRLRHLELFNIAVPEESLHPQLLKSRPLRTVQLVSLEELVLTNVFVTEFLFFVSQLDCPRLQSLGVGLINYHLHNPDLDSEWTQFSPVYPHLQRLDLWSLSIAPEQLQLALRNIPPISYLAIRGSDSLIIDGHLAQTFSKLGPTVRTLKTHGVDVPTLHLLFNHYFPGIETIYMHWKDADMIKKGAEEGVGLTSAYGRLPKVVLWGEREEDVWFLEGVDEMDDRIGRGFQTSVPN